MRKLAFCICENKDAGNREADQRLCFRYIDSTIPLLPKSEISSLYPSYVVLQPGLCRTWSEIPKNGFLTTRLIWYRAYRCFCLSVKSMCFERKTLMKCYTSINTVVYVISCRNFWLQYRSIQDGGPNKHENVSSFNLE